MAKKVMAKKTRTKKAGPKAAAGVKKRVKTTAIATSTENQARAGGRVAAAPRAVTPADPGASSDVLDRLYAVVESRREADPEISHSARLLARGTAKIAQKFGEEAVECLIEAVARNPAALIGESADVLYHMLVMWLDAGITPGEVWSELTRREGVSGIAEKASRVRKLSMSLPTRSTKIP